MLTLGSWFGKKKAVRDTDRLAVSIATAPATPRQRRLAAWIAVSMLAATLLMVPFTGTGLGDWQGLAHADLPARLSEPAHAFWPLGATETPPNGESMASVVTRVGNTLERLAQTHPGQDVIAVSHGGAIRAAIAHATGAGAQAALHFAIQNLSLTVLERFAEGWRIVCVNESVPPISA